MKLLMIGHGEGSFQMRGRQLGHALGARVVSVPSDDDLRWADLVVLIKRAGMDWAARVRQFGKPIVWDALDFWAQPDENRLPETQARALLCALIDTIKPALVIGATEAMSGACDGVYLPHHAWHGLTPTPARDVVKTVGYQGQKKYLGRWLKAVQSECDRRGWAFVLNPPDLRACDLLVAFRDAKWDGWMCREWKSGVKIVNAIAASRPIITQDSAAVRELGPQGAVVSMPSDLSGVFDRWTSLETRKYDGRPGFGVIEPSSASDLTLESIAGRYRQMLQRVQKAQAA